jgi:hypothetical protein
MGHLIEWKSGALKVVQPFDVGVLRENLKALLAASVLLAVVGVNCMTAGDGAADPDLGTRAEALRLRVVTTLT